MSAALPLAAAYGSAHLWPARERNVAPRAAALMVARLAEAADPAWPLRLAAERRGILGGHAAMLAAWIAARHRGRPRLIGLAGGQGSGKSTLAALVAALLRREYGLRVAILALDDLYLARAEREQLARRVHPLFATRGVPGSHDVERCQRLLDDLLDGSGEVALPRFDKLTDDRLPESEWSRVMAPVDVVLWEGWCVGAAAQPEAELLAPVNALEAEADPDGVWRRAVNDALAGPYADLFERLHGLVFLAVPDIAAARRWRQQQEAELGRQAGGGAVMEPEALDRFVAHYERLTRAMLAQAPGRADLVLQLNDDHDCIAVAPGGAWRSRGFRRDSAP